MAVHSEGCKQHPLPIAAAQAEVAPASQQQVAAAAMAEPLASQQEVLAAEAAVVPLASQQEVAEAVPGLQQGAAAHLARRERA